MNKRILELAEQAGYAPLVPRNFADDLQEIFLQKFAESIIRECAEQILAKGTDWIDFAPSQTGVRPEYWEMAQQIKKHFGGEE